METAKVWTIREVLQWTMDFFARRRLEQPRLEAEVLLKKVLGQDRVQLYMNFDQPLEAHELAAYRRLIQRRAAGEPAAYLVGEKEFMSLAFEVNRQVLIPRPDTEVLVEIALEWLQKTAVEIFSPPHLVVDVGTGCGNIAVSLAYYFPSARVVAIDIAAAALEVARRNAVRHGVDERITFWEGDLLSPLEELGLKGQVQLIAANLPYIPSSSLPHLPREVLYEPLAALDGGRDGLAYYRRLLPQAEAALCPGGLLLMEIGENQARPLLKLLAGEAWEEVRVHNDYGGRERVVQARKKRTRAQLARRVGYRLAVPRVQ